MKKLIVFDLDGTLAESKAAIDKEMAKLLINLLEVAKVAIISGGDWPQFTTQVLSKLPNKQALDNLSILPTAGTKYYQYDSGWKKLYSEDFTNEEKNFIIAKLDEAVPRAKMTWGELIEDRGSQITYSGLGQKAPLEEKKKWDPDFEKRKKVKLILDKSLKQYSVQLGGATSIDVTKPGINKAYGIRKLNKMLKIKIAEMIFIGDALFEGGNDYPSIATGIDVIQVRDPAETKRVIEGIIYCLK